MKKRVLFVALILGMGVFFGSAVQAQNGLWDTNVNHIFNTNTGNVGIGTMNPTQTLHIEGGTSPAHLTLSSDYSGAAIRSIGSLRIRNDFDGNFSLMVFRRSDIGESELIKSAYRASDDRWLEYNYLNVDTGIFIIRHGITDTKFQNTGDVLFNNGGGIGVGTSDIPAGFKLAVNGSIITEELQVQLNADWPDYVFNTDYSLMSINELEDFVQRNRHLPGVPSEAEVKEQGGFNVGEMSTILLKKVEELSLYVIELNKQNEELERRIAELER